MEPFLFVYLSMWIIILPCVHSVAFHQSLGSDCTLTSPELGHYFSAICKLFPHKILVQAVDLPLMPL